MAKGGEFGKSNTKESRDLLQCGKMGHSKTECNKNKEDVIDELGHIIEHIHNLALFLKAKPCTNPKNMKCLALVCLSKKQLEEGLCVKKNLINWWSNQHRVVQRWHNK